MTQTAVDPHKALSEVSSDSADRRLVLQDLEHRLEAQGELLIRERQHFHAALLDVQETFFAREKALQALLDERILAQGEQDLTLKSLEQRLRRLESQVLESGLENRRLTSELDEKGAEVERLEVEGALRLAALAALEEELRGVYRSQSWWLTRPLRGLKTLLTRGRLD